MEAPTAGSSHATVLGHWVTCSDLAEHLEGCEAASAAVPLPEMATLQGWAGAARALVDAGVCAELAADGSGFQGERLV